MKWPFWGRLFWAAVMILTPFQLGGAVVRNLTLVELVKKADRVILGQVIDKSTVSQAGKISTLYKIRIAESLKGDNPQTILVRSSGGVYQNIGQYVSGAAHFQVKDQVLLFLEKAAGAYYHLVGMKQGRYQIVEKGKKRLAIRELSGLTLVTFNEPSLKTKPIFNRSGRPEQVDLAPLISQIKRMLHGQ